jgi:flagella basal body P-ring formation protein FlgA
MSLLRTFFSFLAAPFLCALPLAAEQASEAAAFTPQALESAFVHDIAAHFNLEGEFQVSLDRPWVPERAIGAGWSLTVLEYPNTPESTMLVRCQVRDAEGVVSGTVLLHATLWRDAWAVHLPITTGSAFDSSRLETRRCDMLRERDLLPASVGDETYVFARAVPVGRMLTWHDVSRHQQVRKGEMVEVTAADGLLLISMKVLALESGVRGDTITVRNPDSKKDFSALVTDENHVQVQF